MTGVVSRRGNAEAGTVFVKIIIAKDEVRLLGPPPGEVYAAHGDRRWYAVFGEKSVPQKEADDYLSRQIKFDSDIWIVDIDDRAGTALLEFHLA